MLPESRGGLGLGAQAASILTRTLGRPNRDQIGSMRPNDLSTLEAIDLNPLDVISFPPGAIRRFENVAAGPGGEDAILMFVIGGDGPKAEFTDAAMKELEDAGVWPAP